MADEHQGKEEGAILDGGKETPHREKRFAGFSKNSKQLDAKVHRKYICGGHVASYMMTLMEDEPQKYQSHFSLHRKKGLESENLDSLYMKVHAAIRADPNPQKSEKQQPKQHKRFICIRFDMKKLTYVERKAKKIERLNALNALLLGLLRTMRMTSETGYLLTWDSPRRSTRGRWSCKLCCNLVELEVKLAVISAFRNLAFHLVPKTREV